MSYRSGALLASIVDIYFPLVSTMAIPCGTSGFQGARVAGMSVRDTAAAVKFLSGPPVRRESFSITGG